MNVGFGLLDAVIKVLHIGIGHTAPAEQGTHACSQRIARTSYDPCTGQSMQSATGSRSVEHRSTCAHSHGGRLARGSSVCIGPTSSSGTRSTIQKLPTYCAGHVLTKPNTFCCRASRTTCERPT